MREVAVILRSARKSKGLSQGELGKKVGLPQSHISRIESGDIDVRISSLVEIARLLDVEIMFIPRQLKPAVRALIAGEADDKPAWQSDEE